MTCAPRAIAVLGGIALIGASFGLGYAVAAQKLLDASPTAMTATEAAASARAALANPNELERTAALVPVLASLDARNLDAVVREYEATFISVGPGALAMELLAEAWSKIAPAQALQRIQSWRTYWQGLELPFLMRSWARRDLAAARAALAAVEETQLRSIATTAVIQGWADSNDPLIWDRYLAGLPFGDQATQVIMQHIAAQEGIAGLLQRAEAVPEDAAQGFRPKALRIAADIAARTDPRAAAAFVERNRWPADGGTLESIVARLWAASDGSGAIQWVLSQPSGRARDAALRTAFRSWLASDEQAALAWVQGQADKVLVPADFFAKALANHDPKRAMEIGAGISDPEQRRRTLAEVSRVWLAKQPEEAASWLEQHGLADTLGPDARPLHPREGSGPGVAAPDDRTVE